MVPSPQRKRRRQEEVSSGDYPPGRKSPEKRKGLPWKYVGNGHYTKASGPTDKTPNRQVFAEKPIITVHADDSRDLVEAISD